MPSGQEREWIADYQVVQPLGHAGPTIRTVLALRPGRLAGARREVVVHLFDPQRFDDAVAHLRQVAAARSPRVVPLIEAGHDDGDETVAYYSTEYQAGGSLAADSPGPTPDRLHVLAEAARGVHDLHEAGKVHGGVAPDSVFVDGAGGGRIGVPHPPAPLEVGETVMADPPARLDTVDPAVIRGEGMTRASDLWALGATIHRVLSGQSLHPGLVTDDPLTAVQRVLFEPPSVDARLPVGQAELIRRCLQPDPADRPATAGQVADDLESLAAGR